MDKAGKKRAVKTVKPQLVTVGHERTDAGHPDGPERSGGKHRHSESSEENTLTRKADEADESAQGPTEGQGPGDDRTKEQKGSF